ncbi:MAG TPA: hypothetical protein VGC39_00390 [Candidatus Methylacidiphilales bacterium]
MEKKQWPARRGLPHFPGVDRHNRAVIHFITGCTKDRRRLLATEIVHQGLLAAWRVADSFFVGRYVIMPDHIHLFCSPARETPGYLEAWVRYWKSVATRQFPGIGRGQFWQRDFWDTQMRRGESYSSQWDYVHLNPVRHGLVTNPEEWPYQGEMHLLDWHD